MRRSSGSRRRLDEQRATPCSIDDYSAGFPSETRKLLEELRAIIKAAAPGVTGTISYAMPTFDLNGRHLAHFAGYAGRVGLYPIPSGIAAFKEEPGSSKSGKGSVRFLLGQLLPVT